MRAALDTFTSSLTFYFAHAIPIVALALLAAVGRIMQLGWQPPLSSSVHWWLEIMVEGARLIILILIIRTTAATLTTDRATYFSQLWPHLQQRWPAMLWSIVIFALFALLVNSLISWVAELTAVQQAVRAFPGAAHLRPERTGMLLVFFLKNLTIIPFTLVWMIYGLGRLLR